MESKSKILYLYKMLNETTDEQHPISTTQIINKLGKLGISVTRKTVASDIAQLQEFGVDIITIRSSQNMYYIGSRDFELPEVKLLVDAVESSKLITAKKSKILINKLTKFVSQQQAHELNRHIFIDKRIKPENEEIYYTVDIINNAIERKKKIEFKYFEYNGEKEKVFKNNGKTYELSPYAQIWNDDNYYVVGHCEKHGKISKFRIDRMTKVKLIDIDGYPMPTEFSGAEYAKNIFSMYDGEKKTVELICTNELMKVIIDRFGETVKTNPIENNCFRAVVDVSVSPTFFGWVFQFAGKMSILAPEKVKEQYIKMLTDAISN
jgi:predicted DNA-binding transcriptional regulator YafY